MGEEIFDKREVKKQMDGSEEFEIWYKKSKIIA